MNQYKHIPLGFTRMPTQDQMRASREFLERMAMRRSVRFISSGARPIRTDRKRDSLRVARSQRRQSTAVEVRGSQGPRNQAQDPRSSGG